MRRSLAALVVAVSVPVSAFADDVCVTAAADQWKTEDEVKAYAAELGFDVANLKIEDGCYEVYARDTVGTKLEVFFHPVTFKIAMVKLDT